MADDLEDDSELTARQAVVISIALLSVCTILFVAVALLVQPGEPFGW